MVNRTQYLLLGLLVLLVSSCDGMNDLHEPYLRQGETIYAAKVDSVSVGPGDGRAKLEVFINGWKRSSFTGIRNRIP